MLLFNNRICGQRSNLPVYKLALDSFGDGICYARNVLDDNQQWR